MEQTKLKLVSHELVLKPRIAVKGKEVTTTSLAIADHFERLHKDVMKAIRARLEDLDVDYHRRNFALMFREVVIGNGAVRKEPYYRMTRDGFVFIAMAFTGRKAAQWQVAYINAFNSMEQSLLKKGFNERLEQGQAPLILDGADSPVFNVLFRALDKKVAQSLLLTYLIEMKAHKWPLVNSVRAIEREMQGRLSRSGVTKAVNKLSEQGLIERATYNHSKSVMTVLLDAVVELIGDKALAQSLLDLETDAVVHQQLH
jgi:Rha family phage regulatory protein